MTLLLPRAVETANDESIPAATRRRQVRTTVLVVDDDTEVLAVTTDMLKQLGYRVTGATSGQEALERLSETGKQPELAVLDYAMPGMNGITLAALRKRGFNGPILLATATRSRLKSTNQVFEIRQCVTKPYTIGNGETAV